MARLVRMAVVALLVLGVAAAAFPQEDCEYIEGRIEHWEGRVEEYSPGGSNPDPDLLEIAEAMVAAWNDAWWDEDCWMQA